MSARCETAKSRQPAQTLAPCCSIRLARSDELSCVAGMLDEGARLQAARGYSAWTYEEISEIELAAFQARDELVLGLEHSVPAACMFLQSSDPDNWPDDAPGRALYIHKLAVGSRFRRNGWSGRMIHWAAQCAARRKIGSLRLDTFAGSRLCTHYETYGFRIVGAAFVDRRGIRLSRMEWKLGEIGSSA